VTYPGGPTRRSFDGADFDGAGYESAGFAPDPWAGSAPGTVGFPVPRPSVDRELGLARDGGWRPGAADRRAPRAPWAEATGPIPEPEWWSYGSTADPGHPMSGRHSTPDDDFGDRRGFRTGDGSAALPPMHPSAPLPPRPAGVWDRLRPRDGEQAGDDAPTVAHPAVGRRRAVEDDRAERAAPARPEPAVDDTDALRLDDRTGGLEVIGAHVDDHSRRGSRRAARAAARAEYAHDDVVHVDGEPIPVAPYDRRGNRGPRRRRPLAILISLVVLAGIVVGIVVGGQRLLGMITPSAQDFHGQGTGSVQIRVQEGDTLSDIARAMVTANVIASEPPFVKAANAHADATNVQPGVYTLHKQMSGEAALALLLNTKESLLSRLTLPEGLTATATLAKIAASTNTPIAALRAAAADPVAIGLPAYAHGKIEGFLFPSTYDFDPGTPAVEMLRQMVAHTAQALDKLQVPDNQRLVVLTKASIVQAEAGSVDDMGKVARVLQNRLTDGMPLQLDTTVNYANGKSGVTTTSRDRRNPSPYNTYLHAGLPPGAISNPGMEALQAVLNPTPGDWRFFVVVDPQTGDTRFARTAAEHQQNVLLFQQWLRAHPNG
jgi:uncharacterized YceG family protein